MKTPSEIIIEGKPPSGEKILSTLIELYAKQMGVKIEYTIETDKNGTKTFTTGNMIRK